jgi:hypothetical protein
VDPYRDNREALRARAVELDRLLAERQSELAGLKLTRLLDALRWVAPALLILGFATAKMVRHDRARAPAAASQKWLARVTSSSHPGVSDGALCSVELARSCAAVVRCGAFAYHGVGRCERGNYFDEASTAADGTPMCEIIDDRVLLREFIRMLDDSRWHQSWSIELVRE